MSQKQQQHQNQNQRNKKSYQKEEFIQIYVPKGQEGSAVEEKSAEQKSTEKKQQQQKQEKKQHQQQQQKKYKKEEVIYQYVPKNQTENQENNEKEEEKKQEASHDTVTDPLQVKVSSKKYESYIKKQAKKVLEEHNEVKLVGLGLTVNKAISVAEMIKKGYNKLYESTTIGQTLSKHNENISQIQIHLKKEISDSERQQFKEIVNEKIEEHHEQEDEHKDEPPQQKPQKQQQNQNKQKKNKNKKNYEKTEYVYKYLPKENQTVYVPKVVESDEKDKNNNAPKEEEQQQQQQQQN